ncbi:acyltransferase family protein [Mycolicibacterium sp. P9-22]|uniref:acyltransferase family protein n=1 Tax=Mycolicibacterium sp. P9-22 TaxID=2024613 RepID=UPI0011EC873E|nr:acyltransferase family protein [Mycolicibacterium sp. P9-22]KAA0117221.1 acyltransferase [Mycolicibacterium sp. P9-22]
MAGTDLRAPAGARAVSGVHRLDIQGLRGIAILIGVLFHAGLPPPGGFVGMDIFFVVSGFVIANMISRERSSTGKFSFGQFYLRRFRRLTPALAVMVGVTMILAAALLSPFGMQQRAAETAIGAMLLGANFVIVLNTGDYFGAAAESNVLLHTWSLSVEEQFYIAFPAILVLGWALQRRARRIPWTTMIVGAVVLTSLWLCLVGAPALGPLAPYSDWLVGYYGPMGRAWEFAAGGLLALVLGNRTVGSAKQARFLAVLGLALLGSSPWLITADTPYPSEWTLLPVGGTLLVIAAGTGHDSWVNRALATPVMVKAGNWSYSIYLWHWPMIVFANYLWPTVSFAAPLAAALSILPAVASYRWIEQPFRRRPLRGRRRIAAVVAAVVLPPILLATALDVSADRFWLPRITSGAIASAHQGDVGNWNDYFANLDEAYFPCADPVIRSSALTFIDQPRCRQSKPGPHVDVAILGDSHAEHLFVGMAEGLPAKNVLYSVPGPVPGGRLASDEMKRTSDYIALQPSIGTVILNIGWSKRGVQDDDLLEILESLTAHGKNVFLTDDIPNYEFEALDCKYRPAPIVPFVRCSQERSRFDEQYATYSKELRDTVSKVQGAHLLDTARYFCDDHVCRMNVGEVLLYRDGNHLNDVGSKFLVNQMLAANPQFKAALT